MKYRAPLSIALILLSLFSYAQKDTCKVGLYVNSIYDFRLDENSYMADFWMWINYKNDSLNFENAIELTNSKSAEFSHFTTEKQKQSNWTTQIPGEVK